MRQLTSSTPATKRLSRRRLSRPVAITRSMMRPTVSQSMRTRRHRAVLSMVVANHPIRSSKSLVNRDPARAKGTPWVRTLRERRPDSGPGLVWAPLAGYTDRVRRSVRDRMTWTDLVATVRRGPPSLLRPFDGPMNTVEFFIHVEDVRRGQEGWEPRSLAPELADALWARLGPGGMAKKVAATVELSAPGLPSKEQGTGPRLVVSGDPGELTLFGAGRQGVARVEIAGDAELAAQLRAADLGV